jgi:hypothetical protein
LSSSLRKWGSGVLNAQHRTRRRGPIAASRPWHSSCSTLPTMKLNSLLPVLALALPGCLEGEQSATPSPEPTLEAAAPLQAFERRPLTGDIVEYSAVVPVGPGHQDRIRVHRVVRERAPFQPRATQAAVMMLHGDFSTFDTNFVLASLPGAPSPGPSLAVTLASRDIDVWGFDRRWTLLPADTTDFSSLHGQGFVSAIGDAEQALALARAIRLAGGAGAGKLALLGFSGGAALAYAYAGHETQRPLALRHVRALIPLDAYYRLGPDGEVARQAACARSQADQDYLAAGYDMSDNAVLSLLAELSRDAPEDPSPLFQGKTNRAALLVSLTKTYKLFDATPWYHLGAGTFQGGVPTGLQYSPLERMTDWFQQATPFQAMGEVADYDAIWCGVAPLPVPDQLAEIRVPVYAVAAAGGFGDLARYTTTQLGSEDVTFTLVRRLPAGEEASDYGHGDLLFAADAPDLVWEPLAGWLLAH